MKSPHEMTVNEIYYYKRGIARAEDRAYRLWEKRLTLAAQNARRVQPAGRKTR